MSVLPSRVKKILSLLFDRPSYYNFLSNLPYFLLDIYIIIKILTKTHRTMERSILGVRKKKWKRNEEIRQLSKMRDIGKVIEKLKWKYAGHIMKPTTDESRELRKIWKTWEMRETRKKKGHARGNTKIDYTRFAIEYFLVQLNFIPYHMKKSLCLVHNYRFYCKKVWDARNLSHEAAYTTRNNPYTRATARMFFASHLLLANRP